VSTLRREARPKSASRISYSRVGRVGVVFDAAAAHPTTLSCHLRR